MRARKRSGALAAVPLLGFLGACSAEPGPLDGPPPAVLDRWSPVAVADDDETRSAGVNGSPLDQGESLLFVYPESVSPVFWMPGVAYPLELRALDDAGRVLDLARMEPCTQAAADADECPLYETTVSSRWWLETRPPPQAPPG